MKVAFNIDKSLPIAVTQSGINLIAARRLVTVILNIHKTFAGMLLGVIKKVNNNTYIGNGEFGDSYHVASHNFTKHAIKMPYQMWILIV